MNDDSATIVSNYWAKSPTRPRAISWLDHPTITEFVARRVSGDPSIGFYEWLARTHFLEPAPLCLSLGCGHGEFERFAIQRGIARHLHASDISAGAIDNARALTKAAGIGSKITYSVADQNASDFALPPATYDAIFAMGSIHHIFELERTFRQCRAALKPGAMMFLSEYIGPSRFQTTPAITELINKIRAVLPARYLTSLFANDGRGIGPYVPSTIEHFDEHDPSEAVRSAEIVAALKLHFNIVEFRPFGGAIQHMLLSGITGNFDERDERDVVMLKLIALFEEELEKAGAIQSDYAVIVARPRS